MTNTTPAKWVKFFEAAGIPGSVAASYAHIFAENRIQMDMLMDLNKEYLREMGINPMGDIIAILRHAKIVTDQNTRERVLSIQPRVPVATVTANRSSSSIIKLKPTIAVPMQSGTSSSSSSSSSSSPSPDNSNTATTVVSPLPKPRRVLPEHEGRYKITLPSGTTKRSKEILEKKAILQSEVFKTKKSSIFDRLDSDESEASPQSTDNNSQTVKISGFSKSFSSSVFNRLGGKHGLSEEDDEHLPPTAKSILKNSPQKKPTISPTVITKRNTVTIGARQPQKVMLIKKIPAKAATMVADEVEQERMELSEPMKMVSFSSEDEILEFAPRRFITKPRLKKIIGNSVKTRLGSGRNEATAMHQTRKLITFKSGSPKKKILITQKLKSEQIKKAIPIHKRLDFTKKSNSGAANILVTKLEKVKINPDMSSSGGSSVFNRLG